MITYLAQRVERNGSNQYWNDHALYQYVLRVESPNGRDTHSYMNYIMEIK